MYTKYLRIPFMTKNKQKFVRSKKGGDEKEDKYEYFGTSQR